MVGKYPSPGLIYQNKTKQNLWRLAWIDMDCKSISNQTLIIEKFKIYFKNLFEDMTWKWKNIMCSIFHLILFVPH